MQAALNGTRVAAQHSLLYSEIRLNCSLQTYAIKHQSSWRLSDEQWKTLAEFEGVLNITRRCTTLMQYERSFVGAYGLFVKQDTVSRLRLPYLPVCSLDNIPKKNHVVPRKNIPRDELTSAGRTCLDRAIVEAERRWCGSCLEEPMWDEPVVEHTERDLLCTMLDLRTINSTPLCKEVRNEGKRALEEHYVAFAKRAHRWKYDQHIQRLQARAELEAEARAARKADQAAKLAAMQKAKEAAAQARNIIANRDDDDVAELQETSAATVVQARGTLGLDSAWTDSDDDDVDGIEPSGRDAFDAPEPMPEFVELSEPVIRKVCLCDVLEHL